ncbi:MAG: class I SAM-dependent methyltransferase [bacterium]|nr:class I SAM-dependent methyltransferase [bacterium]
MRDARTESPAACAEESRAQHRADYHRFWSDIGSNFPDLGGAESTAYYLENEIRLFEENLPELEGKTVFKTDLWDEAKNTRILRWAVTEGAHAFGIDLSTPVVEQARREFDRHGLRLAAATADVRAIPFRDACFDAVYSMGTVEHFAETEEALGEIYRVLKPGGRAIIGVPNRWDPFLRPLLVAVLYRLGLYGYGFEKSYSPRGLRQMLERVGFTVIATTGILLIPGWLRMLDLAVHTWLRSFSRLTAVLVKPFRWLYRRFRALRRHGYLLVMITTKVEAGND